MGSFDLKFKRLSKIFESNSDKLVSNRIWPKILPSEALDTYVVPYLLFSDCECIFENFPLTSL